MRADSVPAPFASSELLLPLPLLLQLSAGDGINIEDDMAVLVRYASGAKMSYHLTAYSPWEVQQQPTPMHV